MQPCAVVVAVLPAGSEDSAGWIYRIGSDGVNSYHEGYLFDQDNIYSLKLSVPNSSLDGTAGFQERYIEGDSVFATMSGRLALKSEQSTGGSAYGSTLFLKGLDPNHGSDLYVTLPSGMGGRRMTWDGGVKNFALSPAMDRIAYATTIQNQARDTWAKNIYITNIGPDGSTETPKLLVSNMETIQDVAWYSDRELVFLAQNAAGVLGLYKLSVPIGWGLLWDSDPASTPELLTTLGYELAGARSLAVAPDRQLITFLAPLGENSAT